jgi:hypothetical protein
MWKRLLRKDADDAVVENAVVTLQVEDPLRRTLAKNKC